MRLTIAYNYFQVSRKSPVVCVNIWNAIASTDHMLVHFPVRSVVEVPIQAVNPEIKYESFFWFMVQVCFHYLTFQAIRILFLIATNELSEDGRWTKRCSI